MRSAALSRLRAGLAAALLLSLLPATSRLHARGRTSVASGGAIARTLAEHPALDIERSEVRRRLNERGSGTYIGEMLAERDSALARWPDRTGHPLSVWIQSASQVAGFDDGYVRAVRGAFRAWDGLALPVRFAFTNDSTSADVHVTFVDHFAEEISGRTRWARDEDWWITDADIALAVYHRNGPMLDDDAMHAMALHEIGHLLGLDHTSDTTSIMAPRVRVRRLSRADRATARLLYTLPPGAVR